MAVPQVVIVGRPNVGKSSLLNWLAGRRLSIVDDKAGVTRDRVTYLMEYDGRYFELVDTGGIGIDDVDNLDQADRGADRGGHRIGRRDLVRRRHAGRPHAARRGGRPSGCGTSTSRSSASPTRPTTSSSTSQADEFYRLGRGKLVHGQHASRTAASDELLRHDPRAAAAERDDRRAAPPSPTMKVAIVGRRNTGKSTFVNTLAQAERMIVSEIPGTTRDSVDVRFELDGKAFIAIDTPGLRRTKSIRTDIDFYSTAPGPAEHPPGRRGAAVLRLHAADQQGRQAALQVHRREVQAVHLRRQQVGPAATARCRPSGGCDYLRDTFRTMWHVPIAFITGPDRQEREGAAEPRPDAVQAVAAAGHARASSTGWCGPRSSKHPPPLHQHRPAQDLLRHAGRRCSRPRSC